MESISELSRRRFIVTSLGGLAGVGLTTWADAAPAAEGGARSAAPDPAVTDALLPARASDVRIEGYAGAKIDLCVRHRVMAQDLEKLIQPFRDKREVGDADWRSEYWGKWFTSAALAFAYQPTAAHKAVLDRAVSELAATAAPDGYIGSRSPENRLKGWDVWGRKYVLLGLIYAYDFSGNDAALAAAQKHADTLLAELGPGKTNIAETGYAAWKGLPSCSVLEPMVLLYRRTGEQRYLDFARYIVAQWSLPNRLSPNGMRLIEDALKPELPVAHYNASKAYEMTSCFEGLCELYRITGDPFYLTAVKNYGANIAQNELFVVGSGSSREVWFGGNALQTHANPDPMETCVTATWMKYCYQLLRLTGDSRQADYLETSLYNALLGAQKADATWWGYYIPMEGVKGPSYIQHADVGLSCCVCSGPRALMLTPQWAVMLSGDRSGPVINLYNRGSAAVTLASGHVVSIDQDTDYPQTDHVRLTIRADRGAGTFPIRLRIPAWSTRTRLKVNGKDAGVPLVPGAYAVITRRWGREDRIDLTLDLAAKLVADPGGSAQVALRRGPIVLAWDRRLPTADGAEGAAFVADADGAVALAPAAIPAGADIWMAFDAPIHTATGEAKLTVCDYASAGNTWSRDSSFRVWLNQPLQLPGVNALAAASWIWCASDTGAPSAQYSPGIDFPAGTRYFRKVVTLPDNAAISAARLTITADDQFTLYVNGRSVAHSDHWQAPRIVDLRPLLQPGANEIAVAVTNAAVSPAGLIAGLRVITAAGPLSVVTDSGWKSAATASADWQSVGFDDSNWQAARVVGAYGVAPWGEVE